MDEFIIEAVPESAKDVLARYFQFYLYEHAAFAGRPPRDGVFQYRWFDAYWQPDEKRWPFWMRRGDDVAAFAFIRFDDDDKHYEVAEFFVVNRYRGQGHGDRLAQDVIQRFEGAWKLNQVKPNERATAFWRRVIGEIADYTEAPLMRDDGVPRIEQRFVIE